MVDVSALGLSMLQTTLNDNRAPNEYVPLNHALYVANNEIISLRKEVKQLREALLNK